jgi:hypothetical protein
MNCEIDSLNDDTVEKAIELSEIRQTTEKYWRDRINGENQSSLM